MKKRIIFLVPHHQPIPLPVFSVEAVFKFLMHISLTLTILPLFPIIYAFKLYTSFIYFLFPLSQLFMTCYRFWSHSQGAENRFRNIPLFTITYYLNWFPSYFKVKRVQAESINILVCEVLI